MALQKILTNQRGEEISYWKIARFTYDAIQDSSEVALYGFISKADRDSYLSMPKDTRVLHLPKEETVTDTYEAIKQTEEFTDAVDC